jgi:hypothetical protein
MRQFGIEWILMEEGRPKSGERVLVTVKGALCVLLVKYHAPRANFSKDEYWELNDVDKIKIEDTVAWTSLPKPYSPR